MANQNVTQLLQQSVTDPTSLFYAVTGGSIDTGLPLSVLSSYLIKTYPGFLQVGTGAIARTTQAKDQDIVSVKDFGAKGDGVTDDTAAIQAAILAAKHIYFPAGTYNYSALLATPSGKILYFLGDGAGVSILNQTNLTLGGIQFNLNYAQGGGIFGLTIKANAASAAAHGSTAIGLQVINSNDNFICRDFEVTNYDQGIQVDGCYQPRFEQFRVLYFQTFGFYVSPTDGTASKTGAGLSVRTGKISNVGFLGSNVSSIGLWIQQASGDFYDYIDITTTNTGVMVNPPANSFARYLFMNKILADTSQTTGWIFDGTNAPVVANELDQCWCSNSQGVGVIYKGTNLDTQRWIGGWIRDNRFDGLQLQNGTNLSFVNTEITRNSAAVSNTYHGAHISANVNSFAFIGCRIGNVSTTVNTSTQLDNIHIDAGTSIGWRVVGCDLNNPGTGGVSLNNGSSSAEFQVIGNLPSTVPTSSAGTFTTTGSITSGNNFLGAGTGYSIGTTTGLSSGGLIQIYDATHGVQGVALLAGGVTKGTFTAAGFTPATTSGIVGTTLADNANAGSVGEVISSTVLVGAAVALTTATPANITSISLTAGDWDVWGEIATSPAGTTVQSVTQGSISTTSATFPTAPNGGAYVLLPFSNTGTSIVTPVGLTRINVSTTTTVYLVGQSTFTTSTNAMYGFLGARRVR